MHFALLADAGKGFGAAAGGFLEVDGFVVFVDDFAAEDFFEDVFEADDAGNGAPFVDNAHDMPALLQEAKQELVKRKTVGNELQRAHHLTELDIAHAFGKLVVGVAAKHNPDPVILFFFVKRYAGERPIAAFIESLADRRIGLERKHHLTRRHDFTHRHRL